MYQKLSLTNLVKKSNNLFIYKNNSDFYIGEYNIWCIKTKELNKSMINYLSKFIDLDTLNQHSYKILNKEKSELLTLSEKKDIKKYFTFKITKPFYSKVLFEIEESMDQTFYYMIDDCQNIGKVVNKELFDIINKPTIILNRLESNRNQVKVLLQNGSDELIFNSLNVDLEIIKKILNTNFSV